MNERTATSKANPSSGNKDRDRDQRGAPIEAESPAGVVPVALRRKTMSAEKGEGLWLMSFSDMSLILMAFFVLQLAMSAPDHRKTEQVKDAVGKSDQKGSLKHISQELLKEIKTRKLGHLTEVSMDMNGLSIEFKDQSIFATGSARPDGEALKSLAQIMEIVSMASGEYKLVLEGHTDDLPLKSGRFKNNWELSSARALALLEEFKVRGVKEDKMAIRSFSHTKPKQAVAGLSGADLAKARSANRRVVIRLE